MNTDVRKKLERIAGVRDFSRAHPSDDPSHVATLARLEELYQRAETLVAQQQTARTDELAGTSRRDELRDQLQSHLLRHVVRYGELVARDNPPLIGKFRLPSRRTNNKVYLVTARNIRALALANKEALLQAGLSDQVFTSFSEAVDQFEKASEAIRLGRVAHVGARAELETLTSELLDVIERLDTFNRFRFKESQELSAAWQSIRRVPALFKPKGKKPPSGEGSGQAKDAPAA